MTPAQNSQQKDTQGSSKMSAILWLASFVLLIGLVIARAVYPELTWLTAVVGIGLLLSLGLLVQENRKALKSRAVAFGLNSVVTSVLVIAIVGVLNFMAQRYQGKVDLTKNKMHTLSDQTVKLIKGLQKNVKVIYFAKVSQREQVRPILENFKSLSTKFEIEYVDPDKEPARAKQVGIKKYGTLQILAGTRDTKIEEVTEEKLTNALIKALKDKAQTLCAITGHGEKSFGGGDADGYQGAKQSLTNQSYEIKDVNLVQEGKIAETCDAIVIVGPTKAFFDNEVKVIKDYLANGGRGIFLLDIDVKGGDYAPQLASVIGDWHVKTDRALIVDPISVRLNMDASVALLANYSKENPITKEFQTNSFFPLARPLEIIEGAPAGMNVQWLAKSMPTSWGETNLKELATGQVKKDAADKPGPLTVAVAVEGKLKDSKATKNTRLVVFGNSAFASNKYSSFGGNLDFFMNATSWVLEDESLISIRAKEEGPGKVELSQKQGTFIFLLTVIIIPALIAVGGVVIWYMRRRL